MRLMEDRPMKALTGDTDWMTEGICTQGGHDMFVDDTLHPKIIAKLEDQLIERYCNVCPVRAVCDEWAQVNRMEFGVWGGVRPAARRRSLVGVPDDRRPMRRCGSEAGYMQHRRADEDPCVECLEAHARLKAGYPDAKAPNQHSAVA